MISAPKLVTATFFAIACSFSLHAQDITVSEPVWFSKDPAPDELPHAKHKLRPYYPAEMKKTSALGYVIVTRFVDAKGQSRLLSAHGTHLPFQRAVEEEFPDWDFVPGKDHGEPVDGQVWLAVIFNPKSAAAGNAEATPRLLQVAPAFAKQRPVREPNAPIVPVKLTLDENGAITAAEPEIAVKAPLHHAIDEALKSWKFAPARKDNHPTASELVVPVVCLPLPLEIKTVGVPPSVIKQVPPVYPPAMRRFGLGGQVVVDFVVDKDGTVKNPTVTRSDNPEFDAAAVESVRQWTFHAGTRDGKPVVTHLQVPIVFTLDGTERAAFQIEEHGSSKLPPELQYDTPPKVRNVQIPVYPYALLRDGVTGKAEVTMLIGPAGRVVAVKLLSADRPEFGLALTAAAEGYLFDPALKAGKPVPFLLRLQQDFDRFSLPDNSGDTLLSLEKRHPDRVVSAAKLDAPLKPISRRAPHFPVMIPANVNRGKADIEVLIDEDGHARLPRVVDATDPAFGYAAAQAVNAWWFEPPKQNGKPVATRVIIPFNFGDSQRAAASKPAAPAGSGAVTPDETKRTGAN